MTTTVRDNPAQRRFELRVDDQLAGIVDYYLDTDRIVLTHTEVEQAYAGRGLGKTLVSSVLDQVAARDLWVVPRCPYVRNVIVRDAGRYGHLVPEDVREELDLADL